jgi:hypothetical protein
MPYNHAGQPGDAQRQRHAGGVDAPRVDAHERGDLGVIHRGAHDAAKAGVAHQRMHAGIDQRRQRQGRQRQQPQVHAGDLDAGGACRTSVERLEVGRERVPAARCAG